MSKQIVYFVVPPKLSNLCCIEVKIHPEKDDIQSHIVKCREIIFTEPDVIGTPSLQDKVSMYLIMQNYYFQSGNLVQRLKKLGMKISDPKKVNFSCYQMCFRYTLMAKLSPNWNPVGDFLIQGREFLTAIQKKNAVNVDIQMTKAHFTIILTPVCLTFPAIDLGDLDITSGLLHRFVTDSSVCIEEHSIGSKWCHVLPSMKKGQVVKILHHLPDTESGLRSYKELKHYWKNTYGYRLPETDNNIFYCQVYFKLIGPKLFTYPHTCLRRQGIFVSSCSQQQEIADVFITDVKKLFKSACGEKIRLSTSPYSLSAELQQSNAFMGLAPNVKTSNPNLFAKPRSSVLIKYNASSSYTKPTQKLELPRGTSSTSQCSIKVYNHDQVCDSTPNEYSRTDSCTNTSQPSVPPFLTAMIKQKSVTSSVRNCHNKNLSFNGTLELVQPKDGLMNTKQKGQSSTLKDFGGKMMADVKTMPCLKQLNNGKSTSEQMFFEKNQAVSSLKRGNSAKLSSPNKKIKPSIADVDLKYLMADNKLDKLTTASLMDWLKMKGVVCRAREKKTELLSKVVQILQTEP